MPDPMPSEEATKRLAEVLKELEGRVGLLVECAREMEIAAADIDIYANPVIQEPRMFKPMHPLTLTPQALRELVDRIRRGER